MQALTCNLIETELSEARLCALKNDQLTACATRGQTYLRGHHTTRPRTKPKDGSKLSLVKLNFNINPNARAPFLPIKFFNRGTDLSISYPFAIL